MSDDFDEVTKIISAKADEIMASDIVESVVIISTSRVDGRTIMSHSTRGNIYAQRGSVDEWIAYKNLERKLDHKQMLEGEKEDS